MVISHVDDLLFGGDEYAKSLLIKLGEELGYGSLEEGRFNYCGKLFEQFPDGSIKVSMKEYHQNLRPISILLARRRNPEAKVSPSEQKQLRALLGSLQWLVTQVRFDLGFALCTLQSEQQTVGTMMKANNLLKRFKAKSDFALWFRPLDLDGCGLMCISDASLGNVEKDGSCGEKPLVKVFSQSAYIILLGDKNLMSGKTGKFCVLDARSHRLSRVCRSTFAAELLGVEETLDTGIYIRGCLAEALGYKLDKNSLVEKSYGTIPGDDITEIPLTLVTDAKDVNDKTNSDTPSYGSQKSKNNKNSNNSGMFKNNIVCSRGNPHRKPLNPLQSKYYPSQSTSISPAMNLGTQMAQAWDIHRSQALYIITILATPKR